jgi:hypothetical protein
VVSVEHIEQLVTEHTRQLKQLVEHGTAHHLLLKKMVRGE